MSYAEIKPVRVRRKYGWVLMTRIVTNDKNLFQYLRRNGVSLSISNSRGTVYAHSIHATGMVKGRIEKYIGNVTNTVITPMRGRYPLRYTW